MPYITRPVIPAGVIVDLLVGVNAARRDVLERNQLLVPPRVSVRAQIDTGSSVSTIDLRILRPLDDRRIDQVAVHTPSPTESPQTFDRYVVSLALPSGEIEMFLTSVVVLGCAFAESEGIQAMLGRDVLKHCLFVYDGHNDNFSLAF